jgi:hypothetical protein
MVLSQVYQKSDKVTKLFETTLFVHKSSLLAMYRTFHRKKLLKLA